MSAGEKRMVQAEMLLDVSRKMAAIESLDEVLGTLMEMTTWELGAERSSLFMNDPQTGELYTRFAQGNFQREIRILNDHGIAGHVFQNSKGMLIHDVYKNKWFDRSVDEQTGFRTRNMLCVPIKTVKGETIGVAQTLNKKKGRFTKDDLALLESMTTQASIALQSTQFVEKMKVTRQKEMEFLDVVSDVTSEIDLGAMLAKVMQEATKMLQADRSTLFLNDEKTNELFSRVAMGDSIGEIRLPNHLGIAGAVFTSGETINIPYAYADLRFNPAFDKQTGYFTRSILCVPIINKDGKTIGVTQTLNRRGGPFTEEDEQRLKAFTAQVSIGLENAKLFDDVQNMKNYNESMLESMTNAVITTDDVGKIVTCNAAGLKILKVQGEDILEIMAEDFFTGPNTWIIDKMKQVDESQESDLFMDASMEVGSEETEDEEDTRETLSVNVTFLPLVDAEQKKLGSLVMIEDISTEKRMKSTMSRYMDPALADQMMAGDDGSDMMGGLDTVATVLFSDIRSFTTITETLGAQGTVEFLNEYFEIMVDCITSEGGMLDKFIGDAIMAAFGIPVGHEDDEDRGLRAAISMMTRLNDYNQTRLDKGLLAVDHGMGLNTGKIVAGNIGSKKRMDYTMIGDGVNLAARLESACKQYSAHILISEYTIAKLKGTYRTRYIDDVVVKGKTKPVGVYEVLDYHTDETFPNLMDNVNYFNEGRKHYRDGNWDKAIKSFQEALKANPNDKLANTYIEDRCKFLKKKNPKDWDGVWVMTSK
ncbi:MAG: GAF domain-containing protein [Rhodospirillaceae bacterium]|nr:GAF domain-containing protein [Rhodospirillaceae bacterium]MBT4463962.1 GAF domain-containing protein [Rhodospirillaceae bacterium]MBT7355384.1 GAF domain-containing protein [Rhodospirillaceae bacterium]